MHQTVPGARFADTARMLVDLSCYAGLQPVVTKRIGTAARRKALSWRLQKLSWEA